MIPLKSDVSCSSVQGSFRISEVGLGVSLTGCGWGESTITVSSSATGVEAALATPLPFFFGGILQALSSCQLSGGVLSRDCWKASKAS